MHFLIKILLSIKSITYSEGHSKKMVHQIKIYGIIRVIIANRYSIQQ